MQAILKTEVNAIHKNNIFPEKTIILNKDNVEKMVLLQGSEVRLIP